MVNHPNIIQLLAYAREANKKFLVMEYADRGSLYKGTCKMGNICLHFDQCTVNRGIETSKLNLKTLKLHVCLHFELRNTLFFYFSVAWQQETRSIDANHIPQWSCHELVLAVRLRGGIFT